MFPAEPKSQKGSCRCSDSAQEVQWERIQCSNAAGTVTVGSAAGAATTGASAQQELVPLHAGSRRLRAATARNASSGCKMLTAMVASRLFMAESSPSGCSLRQEADHLTACCDGLRRPTVQTGGCTSTPDGDGDEVKAMNAGALAMVR